MIGCKSRGRLASFARAFKSRLLSSLLLLAYPLSLVSAPYLAPSDIAPTAQKILSVHLLYNHLDERLFARMIDKYFQEFDPFKIYLIQSEIDSYIHADVEFFKLNVEKFRRQDYSLFVELDRVIQKSIWRARRWNRQGQLGPGGARALELSACPLDTSRPRAQDISELKARWQALELVKEKSQLQVYREWLSENENDYLFRDSSGKALALEQAQHLFTLHILKALASCLDAHTAVFSAKEAKNLREKLEQRYTGVGLVFENQGGRWIVKQIAKASPADRLGTIVAGDELIEVNGRSLAGDPKAMETMQGSLGDELELTFSRHGLRYEAHLKLESINLEGGRVQSQFRRLPDGGIIAYLSMDTFYEDNDASGPCSERDLIEAIKQLQKKGPIRALIFDLRNNLGGFLEQAVKVVGLFIKTGVVAIAKYSDGSMNYFRDIDPSKLYTGPVLVMTSRLSASASEIVAGALHDYGLALIMGDHGTFGKGSIQMQTLMDPKASSFYKVTIGRYYTVSGNSTQLRGVPIDFIVPGPLDRQPVGEKYEPSHLPVDKISDAYSDPLNDVQPQDKMWFMQHYLPNLQKPSLYWRPYLGSLKAMSQARVESHFKENPYESSSADELLKFQLDEAFEIARDMARLYEEKGP